MAFAFELSETSALKRIDMHLLTSLVGSVVMKTVILCLLLSYLHQPLPLCSEASCNVGKHQQTRGVLKGVLGHGPLA